MIRSIMPARQVICQRDMHLISMRRLKRMLTSRFLPDPEWGDPALCREAVASGKVDGVVLARPALADPYFPRKIEMGVPEKIRPCIGCNVGCYGNMVERGIAGGCAVNPRATRGAHDEAEKGYHTSADRRYRRRSRRNAGSDNCGRVRSLC